MKKSYFFKRRILQHTSDMLRTRLPSLITKLKQAFIHPSNLPLKKRKENVYRFLMFTSKEQIFGVYRKPTFTGQYLRWESFSPIKRKIGLISTLMPRVIIICTKRKLNGEIECIKKILLDNGYPKNFVNAWIAKKIAQFSTLSNSAQKSALCT